MLRASLRLLRASWRASARNAPRTRSTPWLATAALALAVLTASPARADVRTEARTHFRRGMALIAEGQVDAGIEELLLAYEILPHPNVLYNVARAYADAGRYPEAIEYFDRYLETDPADRDEVQTFVAALRARIAAQQPTQAPVATAPTQQPTEPTTPAPGVQASEEEIQALDDSATQIAALAEATQSDALRQRAERLRLLAETLRARRAAAQTTAPDPDAAGPVDPGQAGAVTPGQGGRQPETPEEEEQIALGVREQGDTYEESVVSSSRAAQSPLDAPNSTTIVTAQDIRLSGQQNLGQILRRAAGVSFLQSGPGDAQIGIRGLNQRLSNRVVVLVDGRSVYLDFLGASFLGLVPVGNEDIERVEIIRGPASALYGADAMSGIVNIITRPLGEGRSYVRGGFGDGGQIQAVTGVYGRADRLRYRLGAGLDRMDQYALEVPESRVDIRPSGTDPTLGWQRLRFTGELSYRFDGGYVARAGSSVAVGDMTVQAISRLRQIRASDATYAQTFAAFETPFGLSTRVYWNRFSTNVDNVGLVPGGLAFAEGSRVERSDVVDAEVVYANTFDIGGLQNQFIAGASYRFKEVRWDWLQDGEQTQHHGALFLQDTLRFAEALQVVLSVRGDLHPLVGPQVSPRGSVVIHPTAGQTIRVTGGAAFRSPTFTESYISVANSTPLRAVTAFGLGSTSLSPERLISAELGYMNQMTEYFALELNGYFNVVLDPILLNQNTPYRLADFNGGNPAARYYPEYAAYPLGELRFANDQEQFKQIGGELGVRVFPVDGLDLYANYSIHETSHFDGPFGPLADDQRTSLHAVNAGVQYRAPFGLDVAVAFSWQSPQAWVEQVLDTAAGGVAFRSFGLPAYAVLDARLGWRFFGDQLELGVLGTNLIDAGHREHPFGQPIDRRFMGTVTLRF